MHIFRDIRVISGKNIFLFQLKIFSAVQRLYAVKIKREIQQ